MLVAKSQWPPVGLEGVSSVSVPVYAKTVLYPTASPFSPDGPSSPFSPCSPLIPFSPRIPFKFTGELQSVILSPFKLNAAFDIHSSELEDLALDVVSLDHPFFNPVTKPVSMSNNPSFGTLGFVLLLNINAVVNPPPCPDVILSESSSIGTHSAFNFSLISVIESLINSNLFIIHNLV